MRAAQINSYGGQDVLQVTDDVPKPQPAAKQVLVEVYAAAVNPFDRKVREGHVQSSLSFPATLGGDVAGTVAALGEDVQGYEIGQAVYGEADALSGMGSFAEFAPVNVATLSSKPQSVDFVSAAALPLVSVSAYQALVDTMQLQAGQKILIHGAAGGIGSMAVQLAKHLGAYVAATAAGDDADFVRELGADEVIDYKTEQFDSRIHGFDDVFDTVGGDTYRRSYQVLAPGGHIVSMLEQPNEELMQKYQVQATAQFTTATKKRLEKVTTLVDEGALRVHVDKVYPLVQAAEALEAVHGDHRGKIVIKVKE